MTDTSTITSTVDGTDGSARVLSPRTRRTYTADWALFTDWCAATDTTALPADPRTVVDFLTGCPAAPATQRCRVAGIDHHHTAAGHERPGESPAVRAALGRPTGEPFQPTETQRDAVQAALRGLPSHGWTQGMFGRRDRALLVLSQLAGVPYRHLAELTAGDITIADGVATVRTAAGEGWTVGPADDATSCASCAVTRWLKILDLAVTKPSTKTIARALKKAAAVDHRSPHVCDSGPVLGDTTKLVPLLPPIDQWGALPLPLQRLSPHSLSRRVRDLLAGDLGAHRDLPVDPEPESTTHVSHPVAAPPGSAYGPAVSAAAWDRRRRELEHLAGITDVLTDVERRADELNRRAAELVEDWL
jgi:hypothetical protein